MTTVNLRNGVEANRESPDTFTIPPEQVRARCGRRKDAMTDDTTTASAGGKKDEDRDFYRALDRIREERPERWRHRVRYGPNGEAVKEIRFINRENERPVRIPTDPVTGEAL